MIFEQEVLVRGQEVNSDKWITNKALLELCSNITMFHGYTVGHTAVEGISPVSWIVLGWDLVVYRRVRMFEKIRVATWVRDYNRVRCTREYAIYDEQGNVTARALGEWAALDGQKGTFLRLNAQLMDPFGPEPEQLYFPDHQFPPFKLPEGDPCKTADVLVYHHMIDYNGHLHNSEYLHLADQIYPEEVYLHPADRAIVLYKKQVLPNETVRLAYWDENNCQTVAVCNIETGDLCALVIREAL